jgi:hypothetical protein
MKYYLATNNVDVFHFGILEEGCELSTGQPILNFYDTEVELIDILTSLTGNPDYYTNQINALENNLLPELPPVI